MYFDYPMMYGGYGFFGGLLHILFWIFVVVLVFKLIKHGSHGGWRKALGSGGAVEILKERFAKGEIGKDEYEEKLKVLEK